MENYKGKYIGERKIASACASEEKTYLGAEKVEITFEDESIVSYPIPMLEVSISDTPRDATFLTDARINPVVVRLIGVMAEAELTKDEIDMIVGSRLGMTLNQSINDAVDKLFGKKVYNVTLLDIERVLKQ